MKRTFVLFLSVALLAATLCLSLTGCTAWDKTKEIVDTAGEGAQIIGGKTAQLNMTIEDNPQIRLMAATIEETAADTLAGKKLTATVLPAGAADELKLVDWTVYWIDNRTGDAEAVVTDYVTCTPEADGSCVAYVNAHKDFTGSTIGVKVTTRTGGFSAVCTVTFEGIPSYLGFHKVNEDGTYSFVDNVPEIGPGVYSYKLQMDNENDLVGDKFSDFEIVDIEMEGMVSYYSARQKIGEEIVFSSTGHGDTAQGFFEGFRYSYVSGAIAGFTWNEPYSIDIVDGCIVFDFENLVSFIVAETGYTNLSNTQRQLYVITAVEDLVFSVTVREKVSGIENTINVSYPNDEMPVSVSLDQTELVF